MARSPKIGKPEISALKAPDPFRAGPSLSTVAFTLGPLADLAGTWVGTGFRLLWLPNKQVNQSFRLKLSTTLEILRFTPIGGPVPIQGPENDIFIWGLTYLHRVSDAVTKEALHIEPGLWLNVPATIDPPQPPTVVRQATIPNGNTLLAQGSALAMSGPPRIGAANSSPTKLGRASMSFPSSLNPPLPPGFKLPYVDNPNIALEEAILAQSIIGTVSLIVSTTPVGGIINIPFAERHANATKLDAIFWIETVQDMEGTHFMQLQYSQTVTMNFHGLEDLPHISVATLVKQ